MVKMKVYSIMVPSGRYQTLHSDSYEAFEILLETVTPSDIAYLKRCHDGGFGILEIS